MNTTPHTHDIQIETSAIGRRWVRIAYGDTWQSMKKFRRNGDLVRNYEARLRREVDQVIARHDRGTMATRDHFAIEQRVKTEMRRRATLEEAEVLAYDEERQRTPRYGAVDFAINYEKLYRSRLVGG